MGFAGYDLFSGGTPDYAGQAVSAERQRQARINQGMGLINAVYGGGSAPMYSPAQAPSRWGGGQGLYTYARHGTGYVPYTQGAGAAGRYARAGKLFTKQDQTFEGFQQPFFDQRAQDYVNFAMPQLSEQFRQTRDQTRFGLANRGLLGSSAGQTQFSNLARQMEQAKQGIQDTGRGQAQDLQRQILESKNALISQLYQSADPAQGMQQAIGTAASFRQPGVYAPLANQFSGLINQYYMNQLLNSYRPTSFVSSPQSMYGNPSALPQASYSFQ